MNHNSPRLQLLTTALALAACSTHHHAAGRREDAGAGDAALIESSVDHVAKITRALHPLATAHCEWLFSCCEDRELAVQLGAAAKTQQACTDSVIANELATAGPVPVPVYPDPPILNALAAAAYDAAYVHLMPKADAVIACAQALARRACTVRAAADHCTSAPLPPDDRCAPTVLFTGLPDEGESCSAAVGCGHGLACRELRAQVSFCVRLGSAGDACRKDDDCDAPWVCDHATSQCVVGAADGGPCSYADPAHPALGTEHVRCARGLLCDATTQRCTDARCSWGSACNDATQCPQGLRCKAGQCEALAALGDECLYDTDCASVRCVRDTTTINHCLPALLKVGESCHSSVSCSSSRCAALQCADRLPVGSECSSSYDCSLGRCSTLTTPFVCVADGLEGSSCLGPDSGSACWAGGRLCFADGLCREWPFIDGERCNADRECKGGSCAGGTCRAPTQAGDACGTITGVGCDTGFYCASTGTCTPVKGLGVACSGLEDECGTAGSAACAPVDGVLRCTLPGPTEVICSGRPDAGG